MRLRENKRKHKSVRLKKDSNQILVSREYRKLIKDLQKDFYVDDLPDNYTLADLCTKPDLSHILKAQRPRYVATDYSFRKQPIETEDAIESRAASELSNQKIEEPARIDTSNQKSKKSKSRKRIRTITKAAAIMLLFIGSAAGMAIWMNTQTASAFKFDVEKTLYQVREGLFSTEKPTEIVNVDADGNEADLQGEETIETKYRSMDQIEEAIKFLPELYVPAYIPKGYELESLRIKKSVGITFSAVYIFKNEKGKSILVHMSNRDIDQYAVRIKSNLEAGAEEQGVLIWKEKATGERRWGILKKEASISVSGNISDEELETIAKSFVKGKDFKN